jgi:outer membrane protein, heavy metal efflux system
LQTDVAQSWLERRMQEQRVALLQAQMAEARVLVQTTEAALRGGRSTAAEVFSAREALAQLEQGLIGAQAERDNARLTLARFTGGAPDQPLADPPPMRASPAPNLNADQWPEINAMKAREAAAQAEAEVARQELKPDWSAEIMFSQRGSGFSNMVSIGVSVPLQWDRPQRQQRELAARLARVNELQAEREELTRERALQVQRWQQAWRAGLERLAFLDAQRQPLSTQRVDAALAAYRGGREGLGTVLQARRDALNLALERLALERETAGLWAQLEYLIPDATSGVKP